MEAARPNEQDTFSFDRSEVLINEVIWDSIISGYIKDINLDVYFGFRSSITKRLFRLLDKIFSRKKMSVISFDLNELGFERIGFPKSYGTKKIKDKLKPAINELMIQRVLAEEPKYEKIRPGVWKIEFTRGEFYKQAHMAEALPYKRDEINFVQNLTQKPFELAENQVRKILDVYRKKDGKIEISVLLNQIKRLEQKLKEDKSRGVGYVYKALLEKWDLSKVSETEKAGGDRNLH